MKRQILFIAFCLFSMRSFSQNIFTDEASPKTIEVPQNYQSVTLSGGPADGTLSIDAGTAGNLILPTLFGNNASSWMGKKVLTDTVRKRDYRNANISFMRFPGGSLSNNYFWDGNIPSSVKTDSKYSPVSGTDNSWRLDVDDFLKLSDTLNNEPVFCVNLAYARYGTDSDPVATAAHYAAEWVRYINIQKGYNVRYWELGNENYGKWEAGYLVDKDTINGEKYAAIASVFADSMKAADPGIKVGAVVVSGDGVAGTGYNWWNKGVMPNCIDKVDYWILHEYFVFDKTNWNNITVQEILGAIPLIQQDKQNLESMVATYTSYPGDHLPVAMTEYNLRGGQKEVSQLSALFVAECLGKYIDNGYGMVMLWDMQNGTEGPNTLSPGGDMGFVSWNDTLIPNGTPRPSFFVYYYATRYLGNRQLTSTITGDSLKGYGSIDDNGNIGAVIINQSDMQKTINLQIQNTSPQRIYWHSLHADSKLDKKVKINQYENAALPEGGPANYASILPYGASFTSGDNLLLEPNSVNFVLVKTGVLTSVSNPLEQNLVVYPNPAKSAVHLKTEGNWTLSDLSGKTMLQGSGKEIGMQGIPSGVYLLKVNDRVVRVVKE